MKHSLTLAALVFTTSCFGQVPDWQAEDMLLYMDFDGNYSNLLPGENQLEMEGLPLFASDSSRTYLELAGNGEHLFHPDPSFPQGDEFSLCLEFRLDEFGSGGGPDQIPIVSKWQSTGTSNNEFYLLERDGYLDFVLHHEAWDEVWVSYNHNWDAGSWHTVCFQVADTSALWVDGEFYWSSPVSLGQSSFLFRLGDWYSTASSNYRTMDGAVSKLVAWSSRLPLGAQQFFTQDADIAIGCTDPLGCNYSDGNVWEDGSCLYLDVCGECGGDGMAGCTDVNACNYNPIASCDDGSCVYPPVIDLGEDIETCDGSVVLEAGPGYGGYLWSTGESNDSIEVTVSGLYGVSVSVEDQAWLLESTSGAAVSTSNVNLDTSDFTFSVDVKADMGQLGPYSGIFRNYSGAADLVNGYYLRFESGKLNFDLNNFGQPVQHPNGGNVIFLESPQVVADGNWHNAIVTYDSESWTAKLFVDGLLADTQLIGSPVVSSFNENPLIFGTDEFNGEIDNFAFWSTVVGEEDILEIANCGPLEANTTPTLFFHADGSDAQADLSEEVQLVGRQTANGCQLACSATDSILVVLNHGSCFCGQGSVWQEETQECVPVVTVENACLEGTVWNEMLGGCVVANPSDSNFDGCVSMTDLLDLLSVFGTCNETAWSCGDPLEHHGYDYATVQIGGQCWFAENCRYLPAVSPSSNGSEIDGNAHAYVFEYEGQDIQEAHALENYESYGVLYNRIAMQTWDVCPAGWHIPTDSNISGQGEFWELIAQFVETEVAVELKSDFSSTPGWNGSNNSGFDALPAGYRRVHSTQGYGFFGGLGAETQYWAVETWSRRLTTTDPDLSFMGTSEHWGLSVRCIQDSE